MICMHIGHNKSLSNSAVDGGIAEEVAAADDGGGAMELTLWMGTSAPIVLDKLRPLPSPRVKTKTKTKNERKYRVHVVGMEYEEELVNGDWWVVSVIVHKEQ